MSGLSIVHILEKNRLSTGSVVQLLEAAQGLARRGHRLTVVSRPGGELADACRDSSIRLVTLPLQSPVDLASVRGLRRLLRGEPVQVLHAHKGRAHALALWAATGLGPAPVVVVNRGVSFPLDRWNRWKYHHPRVAAVVCVAEAVRTLVMASGRLPGHRVVTIYSGTDTTRFDPATVDREQVRQQLGVTPGQLLIGQVSVRRGKGWRDLLAAMAPVAGRHAGARLLLVGCEPEVVRQRVLAAAAAHGLAGSLLLLPFRRDLPRILAACDLVVDASWQGTGITGTIREAMAMERAVVATDCGGNRELVVNGEVGLLVPPRRPERLAEAMLRLLDAPGLRQQLGRSARQRVVQQFSTERRLDRLVALYERLRAGCHPLQSCNCLGAHEK